MTEAWGPYWTIEHTDTLRQRWAAGATSTTIAAELGTGRNAIVGKLRRMKLLGTRPDPEPMRIRCRLSDMGQQLLFRRNLTKQHERLGTIVGVSRDGHCWIVIWDDLATTNRKPHPKNCIELLDQTTDAWVPVISKPSGDKGGSIVAKIKAMRKAAGDRKSSCSIMTSIKAKQDRAPIEPHQISAALVEFNAAIPIEQRKTIVELRPDHCRFPLWNDDDPSRFYCGAKGADMPGKPFCAGHERFAYKPSTGAKPWLPGRP